MTNSKNTLNELYETISDTEEYRDIVNKECDQIIEQCEEDILIEQIIHNAIMKACIFKQDSTCDCTYSIFDVVEDKRHKVVYELAKQLKEARAKNAKQCEALQCWRKRHGLED